MRTPSIAPAWRQGPLRRAWLPAPLLVASQLLGNFVLANPVPAHPVAAAPQVANPSAANTADSARGMSNAENLRWDFAVTLDGKPIGTHRISVTHAGDARIVESNAQFIVKVLGVPVYRYQHRANETWQGDCLRELRADTEEGSQRQQVERSFQSDCLMAFAYWNPRITAQQRLVDPQTGNMEAVSFGRLQDTSIPWRGQPVKAQGWSLRTAKQRISIWYAADSGRWIALDAEVQGGRTLSYRSTATETTP